MKLLSPIRLCGLAGVAAGAMYFAGYASMSELLLPMVGNLGGHVILGFAGLLTLFTLVGAMAWDARRNARLGVAGYALSFSGAAAFSAGNLAEGVWLAEFGVMLFALGLMSLVVGVVLLGAAMLRAKVLPSWSVWPLIGGWAAFLPIANSPSIFGFPYFASSLLAAGTLSVGWVAIGFALAVRKSGATRQTGAA